MTGVTVARGAAGVDGVASAGPALLGVASAPVHWLLDRWSGLLFRVGERYGIEMLGYAFMHRAFLVGVLIAVMAPLIGTFLVHRQLALIGDALAHT
ncbi:MAG: metal ABC transporter permease, partial [Haloferacaceae archaeon]